MLAMSDTPIEQFIPYFARTSVPVALPLVPVFRERLLALQEEQKENRKLCGRCYNKKYADYICVDAMGNLLKPDYLSNSFQIILQNYHLRRIRFHDLRHPYVKHTTKKYNSEKQKTQTTNLSADSLGFLFLLFILRLCS